MIKNILWFIGAVLISALPPSVLFSLGINFFENQTCSMLDTFSCFFRITFTTMIFAFPGGLFAGIILLPVFILFKKKERLNFKRAALSGIILCTIWYGFFTILNIDIRFPIGFSLRYLIDRQEWLGLAIISLTLLFHATFLGILIKLFLFNDKIKKSKLVS